MKHLAAGVTKDRQNIVMAIMCRRLVQLLQSESQFTAETQANRRQSR
jgi:hypothetical protein